MDLVVVGVMFIAYIIMALYMFSEKMFAGVLLKYGC